MSSRIWALTAQVLAPVLPLMLRWRCARGREIPARLAERYGRESAPRPPGSVIWLHAASVGETLSALPLLRGLSAQAHVLFTTATVTSASLLSVRLREMGLAGQVSHRFVPLDVPRWAGRFLDHWRPAAACFIESELWPNILQACRKRKIPMALINARMSERSAKGWRRVPGLARHLLGGFSLIAAQSEADAVRLRALGAPEVARFGNLKFAADPLPADRAEVEALQAALGDRPRWLAASTHPGDDEIILAVHRAAAAKMPGVLTCVVPRHPARGAALAALYKAPRRSLGAAPPAGGIWVADTLGELGLLYRCFPAVFMGKSFAGGGQNPWEPACLGCRVAIGPAAYNFADAVTVLQAAGVLQVVADAAALADWVIAALTSPALPRARPAVADGIVDTLVARLLALVAG